MRMAGPTGGWLVGRAVNGAQRRLGRRAENIHAAVVAFFRRGDALRRLTANVAINPISGEAATGSWLLPQYTRRRRIATAAPLPSPATTTSGPRQNVAYYRVYNRRRQII
jgi:hypothetical protein